MWKNDSVEISANDQSNHTTHSYVVPIDAERLIGDVARHQVIRNSKNIVFDAKRFISSKFADS